MSLLANIDHLAVAAGIEAVVVDTGTREYRGAQTWHPVLDGALDLFKRTDEKSIRLVVGKHTIVVQRESDETVALVLPTGHAIAKSLRRMIRRMARKDRGPVSKPKPVESIMPGKPGPQPTQPSAPTSSAPKPVVPAAPSAASAQPKSETETKTPAGTPASSGAPDRGGFPSF